MARLRAIRTVAATLVALWFVVAVACNAGPARRVTADDCAKLRDHRASLLVERSASHLSEEEKAKHRANISAGAGDDFVKRCVEEMTVTSLECQLETKSVEELERCRRAVGD